MMSNIEQLSLYQDHANTNSSAALSAPRPERRESSKPDEANMLDQASGLNEIKLTGNSHMAKALLAGVLLELSGSSDQRWVCWVGPRPLKPLLDAGSSLRGQRILQVVAQNDNLCQIAARALETGRSHTVALLVSETLSSAQQKLLSDAARAGSAECLIIRMA
ncbi:hypothetical protein NCG89_01830 [Spongiibacter taiwanensis]|uniref:hypothetical protein n=1 Tax=Spongiibacter taiwanensis TaxID=1748242 RepID=UPI0020359460|nr:hypothetical protein [Spongiibacter taiwanensis]USA43538.1 hypothetical protein NCG89_01830 [Spongiibacter taiwanensis]